MTDLLPCPFCGGEAELWRASGDGKRKAWIACMSKCAVLITSEHKTDEEAIAAWNTRAPGWQPIETAPKDGTVVLLWVPDFRRVITGWHCKATGLWPHDEPFNDDGEPCNVGLPTHWMPLPTPPDSEGKQ